MWRGVGGSKGRATWQATKATSFLFPLSSSSPSLFILSSSLPSCLPLPSRTFQPFHPLCSSSPLPFGLESPRLRWEQSIIACWSPVSHGPKQQTNGHFVHLGIVVPGSPFSTTHWSKWPQGPWLPDLHMLLQRPPLFSSIHLYLCLPWIYPLVLVENSLSSLCLLVKIFFYFFF